MDNGLYQELCYPSKICVVRLDVKIHKIEYNAIRKISNLAIIEDYSLPSIDHLGGFVSMEVKNHRMSCPNLNIIQLRLIHRFENRDFGIDTIKIVFHSILFFPSRIL